jgi:hypothetical protein
VAQCGLLRELQGTSDFEFAPSAQFSLLRHPKGENDFDCAPSAHCGFFVDND